MRKTIMLMALLAPLMLGAQDSSVVSEVGLYHQMFIRRDSLGGKKFVPRVFGQGYDYFPRSYCGWWGFAYGEEKYLSANVGPFCDVFVDWFSIGISGGAEEIVGEGNKTSFFGRYAATALLGSETTFLEVYVENGPSRDEEGKFQPWYRADLQLWGSDRLAIGGILQTGDGFGPRLRLAIPVWDNHLGKRAALQVWAAPMFDYRKQSVGKPTGLLLGAEIVARRRDPVSP